MSATVEYTELPDLQPIKPQRRRRGNPPGIGRKFGSLNKVTSTIKEGVISGLAAHGYDGDGLGGFPPPSKSPHCKLLLLHRSGSDYEGQGANSPTKLAT
jgi:hypothetical protein